MLIQYYAMICINSMEATFLDNEGFPPTHISFRDSYRGTVAGSLEEGTKRGRKSSESSVFEY